MSVNPNKLLRESADVILKVAQFLHDKDPQDVGGQDFTAMAEALDDEGEKLHDFADSHFIKRRMSIWKVLLATLIYLACLGAAYLFYLDHSPFNQEFYEKVAKKLFSEPSFAPFILYGVTGVLACLNFFVALLAVAFISTFFSLFRVRWLNALVESTATLLASGGLMYVYYTMVFQTDLLKQYM